MVSVVLIISSDSLVNRSSYLFDYVQSRIKLVVTCLIFVWKHDIAFHRFFFARGGFIIKLDDYYSSTALKGKPICDGALISHLYLDLAAFYFVYLYVCIVEHR